MDIRIVICSHCGKEYEWQASGSWALETPKKYNSDKYCPDCQKAIMDTLEKIPILFKNKSVNVEDAVKFDSSLSQVTPQYIFELIKREEEKAKERQKSSMFPIMKRVFAGLVNCETGESSIAGEVTDSIIKNCRSINRQFFYSYWPSKPEEMKISVKVRIEAETNNVVDYAR